MAAKFERFSRPFDANFGSGESSPDGYLFSIFELGAAGENFTLWQVDFFETWKNVTPCFSFSTRGKALEGWRREIEKLPV